MVGRLFLTTVNLLAFIVVCCLLFIAQRVRSRATGKNELIRSIYPAFLLPTRADEIKLVVSCGGNAMPKYGPKARKKIAKVMQEFKQGKLKSGRSGKKVTNPKQAVAIGISEAREAGAKVPEPATDN
jgi:hypothetical protein